MQDVRQLYVSIVPSVSAFILRYIVILITLISFISSKYTNLCFLKEIPAFLED